jgi:hypothetical protein
MEQLRRSSSILSWLLASFGWSLRFLDLLLLLDEEGVELESLRKDHISNGAAPDGELVEVDRIFIYMREQLPLMVILTFCKKVFILISTPLIEPTTMVPFLSSIVTVSFFSFIKNLTNFMIK